MSMDPFRAPDDPDFDNPYAAPKSLFERETVAPRSELSIPCSIDAIVGTAWSIVHDNMWPCLWVCWSVALINVGLGLMMTAVLVSLQAAMPGEQLTIGAVNLGMRLVIAVIQVWLGIGMNLGLLRIARGQPVSVDVLFSGGRYLLTSILGWIVVVVLFIAAVFAPLVVAGVIAVALRDRSGIMIPVLLVAGVGCVGLMLYMIARLWQFYFVVLDQDAGVTESIQRSWAITRGRAGTIILVYLSQLVFLLVGLLAFCVGLIVAIPFNSMLLVVTYLSLIGPAKPARSRSDPPARDWFTNWEEEL